MPRRIIGSSSSKNNNSSKGTSYRPINENENNGQSRQRVTVVSGVRHSTQANQMKNSSTLKISSRRSDPQKTLRQRSQKRSPNLLTSLFWYIIRVGIMGVGIGAIAGTTLTVLKPTGLLAAYLNSPQPNASSPEAPSPTPETKVPRVSTTEIVLTKELTDLKTKLQTVATKYPKIKPQAWFIDLDNGAYVSLGGSTPIAAASTIKIPVLVAFFEDVDAGKIHLDQMLTMDKTMVAGGSGHMQYQQVGKKFSALETATQMIVVSDNTATNMLIRQIGGKDVLNQRFKQWGLDTTIINNLLPDLEGTNKTSSEDLGKLLAKVERGDLLTPRSRDRLLGIMEQTKTKTLLPQGIEKNAIISHKTGDIGSVLGDAGIIDIPTGKRYVGAVFAERPHNDMAGRALIQDFSRTTYQHFKNYLPRPVPKKTEPPVSSSPSPTTNSSGQ